MKNNILKYIAFSFLLGTSIISCNDDELGEAPRLFRPVASIIASQNDIIVSWDLISEATSYDIEIYKLEGDATAIVEGQTPYATTTVETSPYTLDNAEWDARYMARIKSYNSSKSSEYYVTSELTISYPTNLEKVSRVVDNAAMITWVEGSTPYTMLCAINKTSGDTIKIKLSEEDYAKKQKVIGSLTPATAYKVIAFSGEEQTFSTYQGKVEFTTKEPENFDEKYGAGKWIDMRLESDSANVLKANMERFSAIDDLTVILQGGYKYNVNNEMSFSKSITFITGLSLEGNAIFAATGGMSMDKDVTIEKLKFENIDIISDKAIATPIAENTDKGFGGRQVFNVNGSGSILKEVIFKNCSITGFRAVIRGQSAKDNINKVSFNGCTINGIGDQGIITIADKGGDFQEATFDDCTIMNVVLGLDVRKTATGQFTLNVKNCTFCYAPIESTANANVPIFRFNTNTTIMNVENTIFGPSLEGNAGAADKVTTYTAGAKGSILMNASDCTPTVVNSYKTAWDYTDINGKTYPIEGLEEAGANETSLFKSPSTGDFSIMLGSFVGAKTAGATLWRME